MGIEGKRGTGAEAFLAAWDDAMDLHKAFFASGSLVVGAFKPTPGIDQSAWCDLELSDIAADHPGRGWGRAAMRLVTALADRHDVSLYLVAATGRDDEDALENGMLPQADLEQFYASFGFDEFSSTGDQTYMRRMPQPLSLNLSCELDALMDGSAEPEWLGPPTEPPKPG